MGEGEVTSGDGVTSPSAGARKDAVSRDPPQHGEG